MTNFVSAKGKIAMTHVPNHTLREIGLWLTTAGLLLSLAAGCAQQKRTDEEGSENVAAPSASASASPAAAPAADASARPAAITVDDDFTPEHQIRSVDLFNHVQIVEGARTDPSLYPSHFDGSQLNAAGQDKIDLIIQAQSPGQPLVIYISTPNDARQTRQRDAVERYVKDSGADMTHLQLVTGPNPDSSFPASTGLTHAKNLENANKANNGSTSSGAGGMSTAGGEGSIGTSGGGGGK
jgi:hypothetical protein